MAHYARECLPAPGRILMAKNAQDDHEGLEMLHSPLDFDVPDVLKDAGGLGRMISPGTRLLMTRCRC